MNPISIELVFENCEVVDIPIKYIESFHLGDISRSMTYKKVGRQEPVTKYEQVITNGWIQFNGAFSVGILKTSFGELAYNRIAAHNDITVIVVKYDTYTETYGVVWPHSEYNEDNNPNQSVSRVMGGLLVEIKR